MKTVGQLADGKKRKLSDYNTIHENLDQATAKDIHDITEAAVFFDSTGNQFKEKGSDCKKKLSEFKQKDLFDMLGVERETYVFGPEDYVISEHTTTKKILDKASLIALKGEPGIDDDYFQVVVTLNEEKIFKDYIDKTLPAEMSGFVTVATQLGLGIKKNPVKKSKKGGTK